MSTHPSPKVLHRYLDDELAAGAADSLRTHLARCTLCRRRLAGLERTVALIERLERISPPPEFTAQVMARLPRAMLVYPRRHPLPSWQRTIVRWFVPTTGLAGLMLLLLTLPQLLSLGGLLVTSETSWLASIGTWLRLWLAAPDLALGNLAAASAAFLGQLAVYPNTSLLLGLSLLLAASFCWLSRSLSPDENDENNDTLRVLKTIKV